MVFELFTSLCPRTCENFRALCTGEKGSTESGLRLSYENTPFHRVVRGGWVQGGGALALPRLSANLPLTCVWVPGVDCTDINGGHGDGGESIYGPTFADETFDVKHDRPGILVRLCATTARHTYTHPPDTPSSHLARLSTSSPTQWGIGVSHPWLHPCALALSSR